MKKTYSIIAFLTIFSLLIGIKTAKADTYLGNIEIPTIASLGVGARPIYGTSLNNKVYRINQTGATVSIIDAVDNYVRATLSVTASPKIAVPINNKVFIFGSTAPGKVIDYDTDSIVSDINLTADDFMVVGNYIYLVNGANSNLTIIDSTTNAVVNTITIGSGTKFLKSISGKLYIANSGSNNVSVINTATNTFIKNISVGSSPQYITYLNNKLYVSNYNGGTVSVIDTSTDTFVKNITTGTNPKVSVAYNNFVYVGNFNGNTISVIDTSTDTVSTSMSSTRPNSMIVYNSTLYVGGTSDGQIRMYDLTNNTYTNSITIFGNSNVKLYAVVGEYLYLATQSWSGDVTPSSFIIIHLTDNSVTLQYSFGKQPSTFAYSNNKFFVNYEFSDNLAIFSANTNSHIKTIAGTFIPEAKPVSINSYNNKLYVTNSASSTVSVIDIDTSSILATIKVGNNPVSSTLVGGYLYVNNYASSTISVINLATNSVINTIALTNPPLSSKYRNGKLYVNSENFINNTLDIIDTSLNSVVNTLTVGSSTHSSTLVGNKLYLNQYGNSVKIIDTDTDSISGSLSAGIDPLSSVPYGNKLYIINNQSNNVYAYNTASGTYSTINVGTLPYTGIIANNKLYVYAMDGVSVINTTTDSVSSTIPLNSYVNGAAFIGHKIYSINYSSSTLAIIDTDNDSVFQVVNVGLNPVDVEIIGDRIYTVNKNSNNVSVIQGDDFTGPRISNIITSPANPSTVIIIWTTNEYSVSDLNVNLGGGNISLPSSGGKTTTTHSVTIGNLSPGSSYSYNITATDAYGNTSTTTNMNFYTPIGVNQLTTGNTISSSNVLKNTSVATSSVNNKPCPNFTVNLKLNSRGKEVIDLKKFLNANMNEKLNIKSDRFDVDTLNAVKRYQSKYKNIILSPLKLKNPTGLWYFATRSHANMMCSI